MASQAIKGKRRRGIFRFLINNFYFPAYNTIVEEITITQNGFDGLYMSYLFTKVRDRFSFLPSTCNLARHGDCAEIAFQTEREYCPYVRKFTETHIADVISVGYKYAFFEKRLALPLLNKVQKRLLLTALVAADYREDKAMVSRKIRGSARYCIDGVYHFRLRDLQKRWEGIAEYVPTDMSEGGVDDFLSFLAEDGVGKLFIKNGKVYDEEYRPLNKSLLTGVESTVGEILLGGAEYVYCFGEVEKDLRSFLEKYYGNKAVFC
jgi:hypothetical protein